MRSLSSPFWTGFFVGRLLHHDSRTLILSWQIAPLLFDTIVTTMTIGKAFAIRRQYGGGTHNRLIQTFIREGAWLPPLTWF